MIGASDLPERPPSEVEWEDLLVKLDIAPRALRVAVDDAGDSPELRAALKHVLEDELIFRDFLDALSAGEPVELGLSYDLDPVDDRALRDLVEAYEQLRGRNFAKIQRRGLEVWDWKSECRPQGRLTGYQALLAMQRADVQHLAGLRGLRGA